MSLWWLVLIILVALGFWASTQKGRPISVEEDKDYEDNYEKEFEE